VTRGVELTAEARPLAETLTQSFAAMAAAIDGLSAARLSRPLRLSCAPFYGNHVLLPHLPTFQEAHPEIAVEVSLDFDVIDFRKSDLSGAIRYGLGDWPGLTSIPLHRDWVSPVAAPSLLAGRAMPLTPDQITGFLLARDRMGEGNWPRWCQAVGGTMPADHRFVSFDNRILTLDFALAGNGVALADLRISHKELIAGQIVRLHPDAVEGDRGMFLVYPDTPFPDPRLEIFADWIRTVADGIDAQTRF
jgi:LysR family glycine cleavage system transcriptional activator